MSITTKPIQNRLKHFTPTEAYNILVQENAIIVRLTPQVGIYAGRVYYMEMTFPLGDRKFPFHPPIIVFISKIKHMNVYSSGSICLDILQDQWSASLDFNAIFNSILLLLEVPNPNSKANYAACGDIPIDQFEQDNSTINPRYDQLFMK